MCISRRLCNRLSPFLNSTVLEAGSRSNEVPSKSYTEMKFYVAISPPRWNSIRISYRRVNFIPIEFRAQSADRLRNDRILKWLLELPELFARYCTRNGNTGLFINFFKDLAILLNTRTSSLNNSNSHFGFDIEYLCLSLKFELLYI